VVVRAAELLLLLMLLACAAGVALMAVRSMVLWHAVAQCCSSGGRGSRRLGRRD
jgi:hypothetical protein